MSLYTEHPGRHVADITVYALSYCPYCKATLEFLNTHDIEYQFAEVDTAPGSEQMALMQDVEKYNRDGTFPTVVIDGGKQVIVGYNEQALERLVA